MAATYTIDASVFVNAFNSAEVGHAESRSCLEALQARSVPLIVPNLVLVEVAAAIRRVHGDPDLAQRFAETLSRLPNLILIPLDQALTQQALDVATRDGLRGSDAIYVAVALRFGSTLITLDKAQGERVAQSLPALSPAQALKDF